MRKIMIIIIILVLMPILFTRCDQMLYGKKLTPQEQATLKTLHSPETPPPPADFGKPDKVDNYDGGDGYRSVTYIWYCFENHYVSITNTWSKHEYSWYWTPSIYTSDCISK
jgi:hypothetical protein